MEANDVTVTELAEDVNSLPLRSDAVLDAVDSLRRNQDSIFYRQVVLEAESGDGYLWKRQIIVQLISEDQDTLRCDGVCKRQTVLGKTPALLRKAL